MILEAYQEADLATLKKVIFNDLESVSLQRYPIIQRIKELMSESGDGVVLMSGSGPSVFGLFDDKRKALQAVNALKGIPADIFVERICKKKM